MVEGKKKPIYMNTLMHKNNSTLSINDSVVLRNALALMLLLASRMDVHSYRATNLHKPRHLLIGLPCAGVFFFFFLVISWTHFSPTVLAGLKRMRERHATTQMVLPLGQYIHVEQLANFRAACGHKVDYSWHCPKMERDKTPEIANLQAVAHRLLGKPSCSGFQ